jgi:hypothetical protein
VNHQLAVEAIAEIERQFDVNSLLYRDLQIWPLIRLKLWELLLYPNRSLPKNQLANRSSTSVIKTLSQVVQQPLKILREVETYLNYRQSHRREIARFKALGKTDILFFTQAAYHTENFDGKFYDPHADSLIDLIRHQYRFLKVEYSTDLGLSKQPRVESTAFIDPSPFLAQKELAQSYFSAPSSARIKNFSHFQALVLEITQGVELNEDFFIQQAQLLEQHQVLWLEILSAVNPKAVFVVFYYHVVGMALLSACRKLGILSIDIQHGKQGKYHGLYTHWTKIPEQGYALLPDFFWSWGQESQANIHKWQPSGCLSHRSVIGGNRWLGRWLEGDQFITDDQETSFFESLNAKQKVILISLQHDGLIPTFVLEAMRQSPGDWLWLIRLHPVKSRRKMPEIAASLSQCGINNFEIDGANRYPLYALLRSADHHITCWSSVCYEAIAFNVSTTIVDPAGLRLYEDYIQKGIFTYALSSDEVLEAIQATHSKEFIQESVSYIETSRKVAQEALQMILG